MFLLLFSGAGSLPTPPPVVTHCGFQPSAYQNNAFQNCAVTTGLKVGWPDTLRRRRPRKELERLLKLQKDATFGRKWFEEFEQAQAQFARDEQKAALAEAAKEAAEAVRSIEQRAYRPAINELAASLQVAQVAQANRRVRDAVAATEYAKGIAAALHKAATDDWEALFLLFDAEESEMLSDDEEGLEILLG